MLLSELEDFLQEFSFLLHKFYLFLDLLLDSRLTFQERIIVRLRFFHIPVEFTN